MRTEYDQEIERRILHYNPEQSGHLELVPPQREIGDEREGQKVCGIISVGVSCQMGSKGLIPYTKDTVVRTTSKGLCRLKVQSL